jgi:lysyl endopeptidase
MPLPYLRVAAAACAFAMAGASLAAGVVAVGPARYDPPPRALKAAVVPQLLAPDAPARAIVLPAVSAAERGALKSANAGRLDVPATASAAARKGGAKARPLAIGYGRTVPSGARLVAGSTLDWVAVDGGRAARIELRSEGAAALRVALAVDAPAGVAVRVRGSAADGPVFGPYDVSALVAATPGAAAGVAPWWSPVLDGAVAVVEVFAPAAVDPASVTLTFAGVSHLAVDGAGAKRIDPKAASEIGDAGACEIDIACIASPSQAVLDTARAVAKMVFTVGDGYSYLCTGTLLNDSQTSFTPNFFAANHCIDSAYAASTLTTFWFFDAVACRSLQTPPFAQIAGGAKLLARSDDWDFALLRLNDMPPAGAFYSAWRAEPLPALAVGTSIHHPMGDLKKWSQGTTPGYEFFSDGSSFLSMLWNQGVTEGGSSGAGLFTFLDAGGFYELRGGLTGGDSSCALPDAHDYYSRLDVALPLLREYLAPDAANPNGYAPVVEFYNATLDHYFITASAHEIELLDTGVLKGWVRTGLRFLGYSSAAQAPEPVNPVCRFYLRPEVGDSHFYSGDPTECADVLRKFGASWIYESPNVFYMPLPNKVNGACPAGTRPVWRFFNTARTNHRYTSEVTVRDKLRDTPGWIAEGYGDDAVILCSPNG